MRKHIKYRTIFDLSNQREKNIEKLSEQLIIRVGKGCNFRCIFCNVAENETVLSLKSSIKEILAITFYKLKYSKVVGNHINITISGGEPSIFQKETIFILKYFKNYFDSRGVHVSFDLQSNASNIDIVFSKKLKELGIVQALISSHAHDPQIFQDIIGVKYDIMGPKFEYGLDCLIAAGIPITFNSVINRINLHHFLDHIVYLHQTYPSVDLFNIGCVQPHGMAGTNYDRLISDYAEISPIYARVIAYLTFHGKRVHSHLVGPPLCYMSDWSNSMEYMYNKSLIHGTSDDHTLIQSINDDNKKQVVACNVCRAKRVCSGIWKEFEGKQIVVPIKYDLFFQTKEKNIRQGDISISFDLLKKRYDGGERQFFIYYDQISQHNILNIIKYIQTFGYSWITLVIKHIDITIENYSVFAGINIQILYSALGSLSLEKIRYHNSITSFQFRIQLDIIIDLDYITNIDIRNIRGLHCNKDIVLRVPSRWKKYFHGREDIYYFNSVVGK